MGNIVNVHLSPAKAGFVVWLEWERLDGVWEKLESRTTNSSGEASWHPTFTSYPQAVRVDLPARQVIDGDMYEGLTSEPLTLYDTQEGDFWLSPPVMDPFETEYHSTYRDFDIYQYIVSLWYTFTTDTVWVKDTIAKCHATIDAFLDVDKLPTSLSLTVEPTSGVPPFPVTLTATLTSSGSPVAGRIVNFYMRCPDEDVDWFNVTWDITNSSGVAEEDVTIGVKATCEFYASFVGDSTYEGCDKDTAQTGARGFGGLGLLILLLLILGRK